MLRSLALLQPNPRFAFIIPFAMFAAACGGDSSVDQGDAGGGDSSVGDARPGDASHGDAKLGDASTGDAKAGDATTRDASNGDANAGDASTTDSSVGDASTSDANDGSPALGPAPVDIGSTSDLATAGAYALIGKTGISNVTGSLISGGHLGVSPVGASSITGFSLILDSSNQFSTSVSVASPWKVYASDYATPTPANLTSAILSMQTAYTDAAGRSNPDFLNLGSGDIGGQTLAPGLYTWGTSVTIPNDVTIAGGANDVWIFQITNDLDVSTAKNVTLAGGAQAKNIFWQVAGQVTVHASAHFEGIILCQTGITLQTTASMHGRALAQSLVALDNNAVTAP